jgi:Uma2 family endonuclease
MRDDALLDRLVHSPKLGYYVDRLTGVLAEERCRRERFYEEMDEGTKQEFINGEVVVHSSVKLKHERASRLLLKLVDTYVAAHDLGYVSHEKLLICLTRNDYEPDVCYFSREKSAHFTRNQMKFPAPDFIAEILTESREQNDRVVKFEDYAAHGIGEYWIVDAENELVEQYLLNGDAYTLHLKMNSGSLGSKAVPGFEVPIRAIFDEKENLAALRKLLAV